MRFTRQTLVALILTLASFTSTAAQDGLYDLRWVALCGPNGSWTGTDPDAASAHTGQMQVTITQRTGGDGSPYWEARNASTGEVVIPFASEQLGAQEVVLPLPEPPCVGGTYLGTFDWNPIANADAFKTFVIVGEASSSRNEERVHVVGIRAAITVPEPTTRSVTFANVAAGQTVSGRYAVRMTVNGLAAATSRWYLAVDGTQIAYRIETATTITFYWNTAVLANGTHTLSARVLDAAGTEALGRVSVIVRN
jgi:hypothetical protein